MKNRDKNSYEPLETKKYKKKYIERIVEEKEAEEAIKDYIGEEEYEDSSNVRRAN